jgi:phosphatidylglycerol:prolipoprotein diacylglycerol transferase
MRRILFELPGGFTLYSFGTMLVLAVAAAVWLACWRARRERISPSIVLDLAVWLLTGGIVGARLFFVVQHHGSIHTAADIFAFGKGGMVLYGCIIGGAIGSLAYWLRHRFPWRAMMDVVAPTVALGVALGRAGCFLNGCCYGDPCNLPWAVRFPSGSIPWFAHLERGWIAPSAVASLAIHPTQLYSVVDALIVLGLLMAYHPLRRRDGEVMALLMVTYPVTRFLIERLRDDETAFLAGYTISQVISLAILAGGIGLWTYLARQPARSAGITPGAVRRARPRWDAAKAAQETA